MVHDALKVAECLSVPYIPLRFRVQGLGFRV